MLFSHSIALANKVPKVGDMDGYGSFFDQLVMKSCKETGNFFGKSKKADLFERQYVCYSEQTTSNDIRFRL
jgi:hypothetical protein